MYINDFLKEIDKEIFEEQSDITLFIGSGFSMWFGYPSWDGLLKNFCNKLKNERPDKKDYLENIFLKIGDDYTIPMVFDDILNELKLSASYLKEFIVNSFEEIDKLYRHEKFNQKGINIEKYNVLHELSKYCKIITTNFDTIIEDIIADKYGVRTKVFYSDNKNLNKKFFSGRNKRYSILKLHGDIRNKDEMIVTEDDYKNIIENKKYRVVREALKYNFSNRINIFAGYSIRDVNIQRLLKKNIEIYGDDKNTSYILNANYEERQYQELIKKGDSHANYFADIDVNEVSIAHYSELFEIMKHILNSLKIRENKAFENINDVIDQKISDNVELQVDFLRGIALFNSQNYDMCEEIIKNIIEEYENDKCKTEWEYIYALLGVLLDSKGNEEGEYYINESINISIDKDKIHLNLGQLYLVRAHIKTYDSSIYNTNSMVFRNDKEIIEKGIKYLKKVKNKNFYCDYLIIDCVSKLGNTEKVLKLSNEAMRKEFYYPRVDLIVANIYYYEAKKYNRLMCKSEERKELFRKSSIYFRKYINSLVFSKDSNQSKAEILENFIYSLMGIDKHDEAEEYCLKLLEIDPARTSLHMQLIQIYIEIGNFNGAIKECDYLINNAKLIDKYIHIVKFFKAKSIAILADKNPTKMKYPIEICKEIVRERRYADIYYFIALMYRDIKDYPNMKKYIVESAKAYPLNEYVFEKAIELLGCEFVKVGCKQQEEFDIKKAFREIGELYQIKQEFQQKGAEKRKNQYCLFDS